LILLSGPSLVLVFMLVQIRGTTSKLREAVSTGGLWFGTLTQSLSMLLFFSWCLRIDLQLDIECLHEGIRATMLVYFAGMIQSRNHIFFGCGFCSRLWRTCMERCNILNPPNDWEDILEEGC